MILVLTGTHHQPFDRLVRAAVALAGAGHTVVVQAGTSEVLAPGCERHAWLAPDALGDLADAADAIVTHAGPGSLFLAWDRGKIPVVVPRRAALGEHVDDHQVRFAAVLGERAVVVTDVDQLGAALDQVRGVVDPGRTTDPQRTRAFVEALATLADAVVHRSRHRSGLRATFRNVFFRLGTHRR